ncbi:MAG: DUF4007 family protein [Anaerolineaceae bacterium]|nr:DUF4007 family protein [Anaerolineaceae bacterium]
MAEFKFGFEEIWFRLILKRLPDHPDLFLPRVVEEAQNILRVGKLKVGAARAWAESAGLVHKIKTGFYLTPLGKIIAHHDPDMEEDGIWWALHYNLARHSSPAWFYAFYFNVFEVDEFSRSDFESEIRTWWDQTHEKPMTDSVFDKLVFSPFKQVFNDTRLGEEFGFCQAVNHDHYNRLPTCPVDLPSSILGYALLDWARRNERQSINLETLLDPWGVGKIMRQDKERLDTLLVEIGEKYEKQALWISHTAGLNSVSFADLDPLSLVCAYYNELDGDDPIIAIEKGRKQAEEFRNDGNLSLFS